MNSQNTLVDLKLFIIRKKKGGGVEVGGIDTHKKRF